MKNINSVVDQLIQDQELAIANLSVEDRVRFNRFKNELSNLLDNNEISNLDKITKGQELFQAFKEENGAQDH